MSDPQPTRPFVHTGGSPAMIRTALANLLWSVLTLSLWRFWGRTRVRRLLWGGTIAWGDPVEYTGTGKELFKGFLLVLVVIYLPLVAGFAWAQTMAAAGDPRGPMAISFLYVLTILLVTAGMYRARRYQMSRTLWRGIRGGQTGSAISYAARSLLVWVLVPLSAGWALPWGEMWLARYRFANTTFGDRHLSCEATAQGLYGRFALVWVSGLVFVLAATFFGWAAADIGRSAHLSDGIVGGIYAVVVAVVALFVVIWPWAWYRAAFYRQLAGGIAFEGGRFQAEPGSWRLIRLALGNMVITVLSLGILRPWAALRTFRYGCAVIAVDGVPDFDRIHQGADAGPGMGEGLISVLDGAGEF